jgi:hypothetical protein
MTPRKPGVFARFCSHLDGMAERLCRNQSHVCRCPNPSAIHQPLGIFCHIAPLFPIGGSRLSGSRLINRLWHETMTLSSWLNKWLGRDESLSAGRCRGASTPPARRRPRLRLSVEALEDRPVPATIAVTTLASSGLVTLREAVSTEFTIPSANRQPVEDHRGL